MVQDIAKFQLHAFVQVHVHQSFLSTAWYVVGGEMGRVQKMEQLADVIVGEQSDQV